MTEPAAAPYAQLHSGLIGLPRAAGVDLVEVPEVFETAGSEPRWREDLRFFLICYFTAFCAFLFLLG